MSNSYPPEYIPKLDLRKAQDDGDKLSATELLVELENASTSINQLVAFMRSITTVTMKIQPSQVSGTLFVIEDEQTATAAQVSIFFANGVTIDPLLATVGVFINGHRLPDSEVTLFTDHVDVTPALTLNDNIMMEIHDNADSVFNDLASIANGLGASLVGIEDIAGIIAASNVEDALGENRGITNAFITAVGDLTKYLKADVAVPLEADQDANNFTWKNLKAAVDPNDPVILSQISAVLATLSDLANTFLPLAGGVMQGAINMGGKRIVNLGAPLAASDAARKQDVDAISTDLDKFIPAAGKASVEYPAQANITGALSFNHVATTLASSTQDDVAAVPTLAGLAKPSQPDQVANKQIVDELETNLQGQISALSSSAVGNDPDGSPKEGASIGGCILDGAGFGAVPDINSGGIYNFTTLTVVAAQTPAEDTFIFGSGDITVNGNISMAGLNLDISTDGDITIDAASTITCAQLLLRAGGTITINGVIVAEGGPFLQRLAQVRPSILGVAGYVRIDSGLACDIGAAGSITTTVCNIQAGASSVMAGVINAQLNVNSGGIGGDSNGSANQAGTGATFGRDTGFLRSQGGAATFEANAAFDDITNNNYTQYRYSGYGGKGDDNNAIQRGGGGGAGGTAGGNGGNGGNSGGIGGTSRIKSTFRPYLYDMCPGGAGAGACGLVAVSNGGRSGGAVIIYVAGDLVATGFAITANGATGTVSFNGGGGGGGGGAIRVVCGGLLTDGTADANGAVGGVTGQGGGGGGGGSVHFIATSITGTQTANATGGGGGGGGATGGAAGTTSTVVMPSVDLLCFASDGYWGK